MAKVGILRKRDFGMLGILLLAIYLSLNSNRFDFLLEPAWFLDQRIPFVPKWKHIPPVITDLDGDGLKEIIYITKELELKIISAVKPDEFKEDIYTPKVIATKRMTEISLFQGRTPIVLKTGYVDPYSVSRGRSQVIVVMREDWTIVCYNSKLEMLWEKAITHTSHEAESLIKKFEIQDVSITISPLGLSDNSTGLVIVGASMGLKSAAAGGATEGSGGLSPDVKVDIEGLHEHSNSEEDKVMNLRASLEHYSVYALDASDGRVIWSHDGSEVRNEQFTKSLPQHAYHLDAAELARQTHHGVGINDWMTFRQSLLAELPHTWRSSIDASSRLAHFERRHIGAGAGNQAPRPDTGGRSHTATAKDKQKKRRTGNAVSGQGRFTGIETPPLDIGAALPHEASEHTAHPNVVVAHTRRGVEVIGLRSGLPITSLALSQDTTYADIDGDGVVDTILILDSDDSAEFHGSAFGHEEGGLLRCSVMVVSGLPPRYQLFNGTLCVQTSSIRDPLARPRLYSPDQMSAATPVILHAKNMVGNKKPDLKQVVIAINIGVITCFKSDGEIHWQVIDGPTWPLDTKEVFSPFSLLAFDWDTARVDELGTHDNHFAQMIVMGATKLALISRDGEILTYVDIPKTPLLPPIFGDFDNDGIMDVVVVTADAILGYRLEVTPSARGMLIAIIILAVIAVIVFVSNVKTEVLKEGAVRGGGKHLAPVLSIVRSTDDWHID